MQCLYAYSNRNIPVYMLLYVRMLNYMCAVISQESQESNWLYSMLSASKINAVIDTFYNGQVWF